MSVKHFIIISSSYVDGNRIAMDFTSTDKLNIMEITRVMNRIKKECGYDVPLSTQCLSTASADWSSVVAFDSFFDGIVLYTDPAKFISVIQKSRILNGVDVAKYILSLVECTHTKLQKLTYFCYAEYLCRTNRRLFEDTIYAFTYGPVVDSIYKICKNNQGDQITQLDTNNSIHSTTPGSAAKSKILFSSDGPGKLAVIDDTIQKYGNFSASVLVDITHRQDSPWHCVYNPNIFHQLISDSDIVKHHFKEQI